MCYDKGIGVDAVNYVKMLECYQKAAAQKPFYKFVNKNTFLPNIGVIEAENALGNTFRDGRGVDMDETRSFRHHLRAAQYGLAEAQNNVGMTLYSGKGVKQNFEFAREWFRKAAEQGIAEAQFNYAQMLEKGQGSFLNV
jgi:TPR repeat protein